MIDGVVAPADTLKTFHFGEVARYYNGLAIARGAYPGRAIRESAWRRLSPDLQALLTGLQPAWESEIRKRIEHAQQEGLEAGHKDGVLFRQVAPAEQARFDRLYGESAERTAHMLDRRGLPGTQLLGTVQRSIRTGICSRSE
jgi:TRAP-type C4-dicarboxylate transport system substrate-binding protein